jgi:acyl carrier protein
MDKAEIMNRLTPVFRTVFNNDTLEVTDTLTANDVANWDSLSHMLLIAEVEKTFSIKFKLKELNKMHNTGDMIDMISGKL